MLTHQCAKLDQSVELEQLGERLQKMEEGADRLQQKLSCLNMDVSETVQCRK